MKTSELLGIKETPKLSPAKLKCLEYFGYKMAKSKKGYSNKNHGILITMEDLHNMSISKLFDTLHAEIS